MMVSSCLKSVVVSVTFTMCHFLQAKNIMCH
jgi:hypothetical protein